MAKKIKRKEGYYWVKTKDWSGFQEYVWKVLRFSHEDGGIFFIEEIGYKEDTFKEINENRIKSPDEK